MTEHFVGKYEVEYKFRVKAHDLLLQRLISLGASEFVVNNREQDTYYEMADHALAQQKISMSVRSMEPSGIKLWIVKGPGDDRCEAVNVESVEKTDSMLRTLGYRAAFEIAKQRSIYFYQQFHITLDSVSELGCFAEIAVMTNDVDQLETLRHQCLELGVKLGLNGVDIEPRSYRQLLGHNELNQCLG
ncbi:class IV adenylate cyclase [Photobacterium sp. SDRW27]|uniref:class IV adenylate cyclase n=1 Tax=Photobacterium obscurum TaxID=2829490 RepID=UPI0022431650|nr:class IV adenylate cyclase [Photobacterium obscurum]MCW8331841.1 class IV adenylate cyclase [Photobacterium obscurum]